MGTIARKLRIKKAHTNIKYATNAIYAARNFLKQEKQIDLVKKLDAIFKQTISILKEIENIEKADTEANSKSQFKK